MSCNMRTDYILKAFQSTFFCFWQICGAGFYLKKALTQHLVSHSDVRNHICHACGGRFKAKKNLDRHLTRVHKLDVEKTREVGGLRKKRQMQPEVVRSERPKSKC